MRVYIYIFIVYKNMQEKIEEKKSEQYQLKIN